jgi:transposase
VIEAMETLLTSHSGLVADLARETLGRIREITERINALTREISARVALLAPTLLAMPGCGALTAAKLVGETAGAARFKSRAAFARHNGTAPIPVWSGRADRFRLNRGGNRQLNRALHTIAITQMAIGATGKDYVAKRMAMGNTKREAIRALRRRISDEVFRRMLSDEVAGRLAAAA